MRNYIFIFILLLTCSCTEKEIKDEFDVEVISESIYILKINTPQADAHIGTSAEITWNTNNYSNYFEIYLRCDGKITKIKDRVYGDHYTLSGLDENKVYYFKVVEIAREVNKQNYILAESVWSKITTDKPDVTEN